MDTVAPITVSPTCFFDRHALTGDGAFVQIGAALGNLAVNRYGLTAAHDNEVANLYLLNRQLHGLTATDDLGGLRTQVHQCRNCFAGLALGTRLKELSERYQRQNHACGFKIQVCIKLWAASGVGASAI